MISIALATYNGEKYLKQQLDSIFSQTYPDFELIIGDDCSKDNTINIINEYISKGKKIKLIQNTSNLGFKKNFESIISHCNGDYIAFCDQDDIWTNDHLEVLINNIENNLLICANAALIAQDSTNLGLTTKECYLIPDSLNSDNALAYLLHTNFCQGTASLISKDLLKTASPIPENIGFHDWWLALVSSLTKQIKYIDNIVLYYRQHNSSVTKSSKWNIKEAIIAHKKNKNIFFEKCTDRLIYIKNIMDLTSDSKNLNFIIQAQNYYQNFIDKKYSKSKKYFKKNYKYLYWSKNNSIIIYLLRYIKLFYLHF